MPTVSAGLDGKRIVVVEDDFLLATDICRQLRELGATVLGPAPTPFYASQLIGDRRIDAAVLDVRLHGTTVFEVADLLHSRNVPILFATAYDRKAMPERFRSISLLEKPFDMQRLLSQLVSMTERRVPVASSPTVTSAVFEGPRSNAQIFAHALARSMTANLV